MICVPPVSTVSQAFQKTAATPQDEEPGLLKQVWGVLVGTEDSPNLPPIAPPFPVGGCGGEGGEAGPDIPEFPYPYGYDNDGDGSYSTDSKQWQAEKAAYEEKYGINVEGCEVCDCNDNDPSIYPGAEEKAYDGIDQDCDGKDLNDNDGDGHIAVEAGGDDCDDTSSTTHPGADEFLCNNIDENCDGIADNANDLPYDGIDQDCDGVDLLDVDGDGYCNAGYNIASKEEQCPLELSVIGSDCDDNNAAVHPETDEICGNNIDDNCNGPVDNEETPSEVEAGLIDDGIDNNCDGYIDELDINGGEVILGDTTGYHEDIHYQHYHGYIHVYNGGTLRFDAPSVSLETESLTVEADSSIDISGVTCGSGDGPDGTGTLWSTGGGGAGASHIGKGGNGGSLKGGEAILPYGSVNDFVTEPGSCGGIGGAESGAGGIGGGALTIIVKNDAVINGTITANGGNGGNSTIDGGGGGGGSGGGIFLQAMNFFLDPASTILSAIGGNGGNAGPGCAGCGNGGGGGGGGGGSIEIVYENTAQIGETQYSNENYSDFIKALLSSSDCIHVKGGTGGINGEPGEDGQPGAVNTSLPQ